MASTLSPENIWVDKPSYDKAERLHHEKLAKVPPSKNSQDGSNTQKNSTTEVQASTNTNPPTKSKSKKSKDNKITTQENNTNETPKNSKNSKKNKKKEEAVSESSKTSEIAENSTKDNNKSEQNSVDTKKSKAKEAKEKKNKADKKHRNSEDDKSNLQDDKEQLHQGSQFPAGGSLASEVAKARQHIKQSLQCMETIAAFAGVPDSDFLLRVTSLEKENQDLRNVVQELKNLVTKLDTRVKSLEGGKTVAPAQAPAAAAAKPAAAAPAKPAAKDDDNDEDVDLFGSDSEGEDAEAAKVREERLAAYAAKKSKKPALIAKSNIILDIKPWDDETDMKAMEAEVRKIETDGLLWGAAKLAPVAYNIQKLQISCVVEDDKVSIDWLTEQIQEIEDFVQSVDIAAFNKI